jgi:TonB family protein
MDYRVRNIPLIKLIIALSVALITLLATSAWSKDLQWLEGVSPSGDRVKVMIASRPRYEYPRMLRSRGIEGYVAVSFDVNEEGLMVDFRITESRPRRVFEKVAIKYFKGMKFQPPSLNGKPVYVSDIKARLPFRT